MLTGKGGWSGRERDGSVRRESGCVYVCMWALIHKVFYMFLLDNCKLFLKYSAWNVFEWNGQVGTCYVCQLSACAPSNLNCHGMARHSDE